MAVLKLLREMTESFLIVLLTFSCGGGFTSLICNSVLCGIYFIAKALDLFCLDLFTVHSMLCTLVSEYKHIQSSKKSSGPSVLHLQTLH